jgi:hypothetical protein
VLIKIGNSFEFETPNGIFLKLGKFHIHMHHSGMFDWKPVVQRWPERSSWEIWFLNRKAVVEWA